MGRIVAAMESMQAPELFTRLPEEDTQQLDAGIAARQRLGKVLDDTKPDALNIFASDHFETFFQKWVPTFAVVADNTAATACSGRTWALPLNSLLAEGLLDGLVNRSFDLSNLQDATLGHSFETIFVSTSLPPLPTNYQCAALGAAIADINAPRPEHLAPIGGGGMSHPLDTVRTTEMLPWAAVLGAIGDLHLEVLSYQETTHPGHGVVRFHEGAHPEKNRAAAPLTKFNQNCSGSQAPGIPTGRRISHLN